MGHWTLDSHIGERCKQIKCQVRPGSTRVSNIRSFNESQYQAKTSYKPNKPCAMSFICSPLRAGCQFSFGMKSSLSRHCLIPSVSPISCPNQFLLNVTIMPYEAGSKGKKKKNSLYVHVETKNMLTVIRQETEVDLIIPLHRLGQVAVRACSVLQGKKLDNGELRAAPQRGWIGFPPGLTQFGSC